MACGGSRCRLSGPKVDDAVHPVFSFAVPAMDEDNDAMAPAFEDDVAEQDIDETDDPLYIDETDDPDAEPWFRIEYDVDGLGWEYADTFVHPDGIKMNYAPGSLIIEFIYLDNTYVYERGFIIHKEDIVDYAKITERKIRIKPKSFVIKGERPYSVSEIQSNRDNEDKTRPIDILFNNSSDADKFTEYLDKEPRVEDVTVRGGGKIMKYKLNKKKQIYI